MSAVIHSRCVNMSRSYIQTECLDVAIATNTASSASSYTISQSAKNSNRSGQWCKYVMSTFSADVTGQEVSVCQQKCKHLILLL